MNNLIYSSSSEGAPLKFVGPYRGSTVDMRPIQIEVGFPDIRGATVHIGVAKVYGLRATDDEPTVQAEQKGRETLQPEDNQDA